MQLRGSRPGIGALAEQRRMPSWWPCLRTEGEQLGPGAAGVAKVASRGQWNWWGPAGGERAPCTYFSRSAALSGSAMATSRSRRVCDAGHHRGHYRLSAVPVGNLLASASHRPAGNSRAPRHAPRIEMAVAIRVCAFQQAMLLSAPVVPTHPFTQVPVATRPFK